MRILALFILALSVVRPCVAVPTVTNSAPSAVFVTVATNAPSEASFAAQSGYSSAESSLSKAAEDKLPRRQCEAITKSANRCKRNAVPGGKLCRQHQRISGRK